MSGVRPSGQEWARPSTGLPRAPALLVNPDYYGTLAATRSLGERGVPVYVAGDRWLAPSRWSAHTAKSLTCPSLGDPLRFLDWLCEFGSREPGVVLYPTSDDAAYLYALRQDELSRHFRMYQPGMDALLRVLDKKQLYLSARRVGLDVPETWFPETEDDVARIARDAPLPLLIKPRTQILSRDHTKGIIVSQREDLVPRYREFIRGSRYDPVLLERFPDASKAMVQVFLPDAAEHIYVLAAFVDKSGTLFAARSGMKILQRPRRLGIGLCFEGAPVEPGIRASARQLALDAGYFGLFQLEFVKAGDRHLLIDFNPRYYNQLAFDVARGLPLPELVHAAACGDFDTIVRLVGVANDGPESSPLVFCHKFGMETIITMQRLAGRMSAADARQWRHWRAEHAKTMVDPAVSSGDVVPLLVDIAAQLVGNARHPRSFLRQVVLDRMPGRITGHQQRALDSGR